MAVFYIFYRLLLSRETLHRINRIALITTAVLSFALPLCVITIHKEVDISQDVLMNGDLAGMLPADEDPASGTQWWKTVLAVLYCVGAAVVLARTLAGIAGVMRIIKCGTIRYIEDGTRITVTTQDIAPFSWMRWIVLSEEDFRSGNTHIIEHEKAHIAYRHSIDVLIVDLLSSLQWFNPAMWMLKADLRAVHEYEADEAVLRQGTDIKEYQYSLIRKAVGASGYSITNSFNHSILKNRITMMSKKRSTMLGGLKVLYVLPLVAVALTANARTVIDCKSNENFQVPAVFDTTLHTSSAISVKFTSNGQSDTLIGKPVTISTVPDSIMIMIDGQEATVKEMEKLSLDFIKNVTVLKGESAEMEYGERGKNGVILISLISPNDSTVTDGTVFSSTSTVTKDDKTSRSITVTTTAKVNKKPAYGTADNMLVIVNGEEVSYEVLDAISPEKIESATVFKDPKTLRKYKAKDKECVLVVTLK